MKFLWNEKQNLKIVLFFNYNNNNFYKKNK